MLDAALELAAAGYRVFPVKAGDKKPPLVTGWPEKATRHPDKVEWFWTKYPTANIGAATGDDLAVVDVDPRSGGTLEAVEALGLDLNTRTVRTPSGGWQLHYSVEAHVTSRMGALAPGVDVKSAGGYVLLPPSTRADGDYTWESAPDAEILPASPMTLNQVNYTRTADGRPLTGRIRKRPEEVRQGERHDQAVLWAAYFFREYEPDVAEDLVWQLVERFADPVDWGDPNIQAVINWARQKEAAHRTKILAELDAA